MPDRFLFRGVRLVDPAAGHDGVTDVLVEDEVVASVGAGLPAEPGTSVVEGDGLVLAPGLVDLHAHLREPGFEHKETVETGTRAAAAGGYTALCAMPNTDPVADDVSVVQEVGTLADKAGLCDVYPAGAITRGLAGEALTDIAELADAGVRLFTDDHNCVRSSRVMRLALEYAKTFDVVISQHAQDAELTEGWQMHEGHHSALLGLAGYPAEAEEIVVARDIALVRLTGGRLHVTHVSAKETVEQIRRAAQTHVPMTADVTPHHLTFTDDHRSVQSSRVMRLALEYAKTFDVVISQHAQDDALTEGWQMHEGRHSALLGLTGYPAEGEEIVVARDIALVRLTGGRLHVTHVSAGQSV